MNSLLAGLRRFWLPLFLLSGLSWLFAPAYYHGHYGALQLISAYESGALRFSWIFRAGDIISGLLLMSSPWLFGFARRDRRTSWLLVAAGGLSALDGAFDNVCLAQARACHGWSIISSSVHDTETVLLALLLVGIGLYHARRYRRRVTLLAVVAQIVLGLVVLSVLLDKQAIIVVQYAYEVLVISWLAWLVGSFAPLTRSAHAELVRRLFGIWALLNGSFALIITLTHHRLLAPLFDVSLSHSSAVVGQHGIIAGVLMLYLARHVYLGQRRAAVLLLLLFGSQVIKYSVLTPAPILLSINLLSFVLLLYSRGAFDRNTVPLAISSRLKDVSVVVGGAMLAVLCSLLLSSAASHGSKFQDGLIDSYQGSVHLATQDRWRLQQRINHRSQVVGETLIVALIAITAWSLFRPAKLTLLPSDSDTSKARRLLELFSDTTEDYFKLWPSDKSYYFHGDGFVAYKVVGGIAFALPDPVASNSARSELLERFLKYCRAHGWAVCFLAVSEASKSLYAPQLKFLKIGSNAVIHIEQFMADTSHDKWWRWQRNRGIKAGLCYQLEVPPHSSARLAELGHVSDAWLADGEHREQGFALGYFDEAYMNDCRLHLLRQADGQLVAFANELPVFGAQTQRTVDLIRYRPGHNGTMPYLLLQVIGQLQNEGTAKTFDLGFVPFAGVDSSMLLSVRRLASGRFSSLGLEQFKNKFDPEWRANYLAYDGDIVDLAKIATSLESALKRTE